jgi:hypothetical protein
MSSGPVNSTWTRNAAALLIFTTAIGTARIAPVRADTTESACTPYIAILAPGTWETNATADPHRRVGMLAPLGQGLERKFGSDISVVYVPYSASASDQGLSYDASKASLVSTIDGILSSACATTQFVLGGYSQGADGMGDVAADIGNGHGPVDPQRVLGVALLSDPHRDPRTERQLGTAQPGHGIAGARPDGFGALNSRVRTVCGQGDLYCSINDAAAPFISSVGKILDGNAATGSKQDQLSSSMVSDWSQTNLPGLGSTVSSLENSARTLPTIADPSSADVGTGIA